MNSWVIGFSTQHPKAQVQYASVGSGAGRGGLLAGATQFAGSDAFLKDEELQQSQETCGPDGAINISAYISPISIAFNLPGIAELNLDASTISKIFRGEIRSWQDPALTALNPEVQQPIGVQGAGELVVFMTLGAYSRDALALERQRPGLRLVTGEDIVSLVLEHYAALPKRWRTLIPLTPLLVVADAAS